MITGVHHTYTNITQDFIDGAGSTITVKQDCDDVSIADSVANQVITSHCKISIPLKDYFCSESNSGTSYPVSVQVNGATPSWLLVNSQAATVEGTQEEQNSEHPVVLIFDIFDRSFQRSFKLKILPCSFEN